MMASSNKNPAIPPTMAPISSPSISDMLSCSPTIDSVGIVVVDNIDCESAVAIGVTVVATVSAVEFESTNVELISTGIGVVIAGVGVIEVEVVGPLGIVVVLVD